MNRPKRLSGRITSWKDERGFGFITPRRGGDEVFVHVSAFANRNHRPAENEVVTYETKTDARGRTQAFRVYFAGETKSNSKTGISPIVFALASAGLFLVSVASLVVAGKLPFLIFVLYFSASLVTFMAYARDKSAARMSRWRTAEGTLHLLGLLGGWPGALIARHFFRHKSKKQSFIAAFWGTVLLNSIALAWFLTSQGRDFLEYIILTI